MGFFKPRASEPGGAPSRKGPSCVICDEPFADYGHNLEHSKSHVLGNPGKYAWQCSCGEHDGSWEHDGQAGMALLLHMSDRHTMKIDFGYGPTYMKYPSGL